MSCVSCEARVQKVLSGTAGIHKAKISYSKGTGFITYDKEMISMNEIIHVIENLDYHVHRDGEQEKGGSNQIVKISGVILIMIALYFVMNRSGITNIFNVFPQAKEGMSYGMLFLLGVLTSVHCIAMCGGINLSQCMSTPQSGNGKSASLRPSFLYNLGRVISYTMVGGIIGAFGSVVSFSGRAKGIVQIVAGIFMVIMGLNMLNVFPWLRRFQIRMPNIISKKTDSQKNSNSPFYVGLLNGLMPCGPLQAMQLYALSTGSVLRGALSMFLFSLGTVPLMFGLGALSSVISKKFTKKAMVVGSVLVVILGVSMLNNGLSLSGVAVGTISSKDRSRQNQGEIKDGVQIVKTSLSPGTYEPILVQVGMPVTWIIEADEGTINGCNNEIFIPEFNIEKKLELGDNTITFEPTEVGTFTYSCWMGMIRSTITVTEMNEK
ncbi:MAG TPA: sulfite exporter TauE/SafE family protein [Candidatus Merdenecus merdavium]|nr:sulfite exporter TauE/SafE family protein [Candidatus Merdenecus merdavium]